MNQLKKESDYQNFMNGAHLCIGLALHSYTHFACSCLKPHFITRPVAAAILSTRVAVFPRVVDKGKGEFRSISRIEKQDTALVASQIG